LNAPIFNSPEGEEHRALALKPTAAKSTTSTSKTTVASY
jgi:hypothetical protein